MPNTSKNNDETARLSALKRYGILDTPSDKVLDNLTQTAADLCEAPIALISLIDSNRQWFKSNIGLALQETPLDVAFCAQTILEPYELMEIENATLDPRFCNNPLVTGDPKIRFYAGKPLVSFEGFALGTLCVLDYQPRQLSASQRSGLSHLAQAVTELFDERFDSNISTIGQIIESSLQHGVVITDPGKPDNPICYVNQAFISLTGYQEAELVGKNCRFLQGPGTESDSVKRLSKAIESFETCTVTLKNYRKDGSSFWNELTVSPVKNLSGHTSNFVGVMQDISDRIAAQENVKLLSMATQERELAQEMRDRLAQIVEDSANEIYIADAETYQMLNVNRASRENLGYSLEESQLLKPWEFVVDLNDENIEELVAPLRAGVTAAQTFETEHRRKDGSTYSVSTHLQYMADQNPPVYTAIVQDISERVQQEEKVRLRDRAIEALDVGVSIEDVSNGERLLIYVNQTLCTMTGYLSDELIGQPIETLIPKRFHEILRAHSTQYISDIGQGSVSTYLEIPGRRKNGIEFPIELSLCSVGTTDKPLVSIAIRDISDRMRLESETHELRQDLAHLGRLTTLGEMATGLAHELNQPLTAIMQNTDAALLTAAQESQLNPLLRDLLKDIESEAQRAGDIIRAMRQFIRNDNSSRSVFDLKELILQTMALITTETRSNNIEIEIRMEEEFTVLAHRVQIAQVLVNLLRNSIEAIVMSNANKRKIVVTILQSDDKYILSVIDTGPGLDYSLSKSRTFKSSKPEGMGMGLSISRTLVESHGGDLWSESIGSAGDDLSGAHISFSLPVSLDSS